MNLCDIERELGGTIVDVVLTAVLSVISEDIEQPGYHERRKALEALLTTTLALTALRSGMPPAELGDRLAVQVREAIARMRRREVAMREMGALVDVPLDWQVPHLGAAPVVDTARLPTKF